MAINVLPKKFRVRCFRCYADLVYEVTDVKFSSGSSGWLVCPVCGASIIHKPEYEVKDDPSLPHLKKVD